MQPVATTNFGTRTPQSRPRVGRDVQLDSGLHNPSSLHVPRTHASERRSSSCESRHSKQSAFLSTRAAPRQLRPPSSLHALPIDGVAETVHQLTSLDHAAVVSGAHSALLDVAQHVSLAYERVTLPCSSMNCGDAIYRSTLDPALRMERRLFPDPRGLALLGSGVLYLLATPGVLAGFIDTYILAPLQRVTAPVYGPDDIKLGKKLAQGGFGTVYRGELIDESGEGTAPIVVKKAKEFGEAEVWMNERLMRASKRKFAEFLTAFEEDTPGGNGPLWLLWQYEGDSTLADLMLKRDFPQNMESVLGLSTTETGVQRKAAVLRVVMQQILSALQSCHDTGIVHRDIKPQNVILSEMHGCCKLIDLGAAADLRIGINYIPDEFLLDPRYAPPQQYIMSPQTVRAPPKPVAALLSPVLWRLNTPDRFDMYSVGILFMQLVFAPIRPDNGLAAFNRRLASFDYDLQQWREYQEGKGSKEWVEGFKIMDADGGAAWDLATHLVAFNPSSRLSAAAALRHPWVTDSALGSTLLKVKQASKRTASALGGERPWLGSVLEGTQRVGGLTEAQLAEELGPSHSIPQAMKEARATIAWWQQRQAKLSQKLSQRRSKLVSSALQKLPLKATQARR